MIRKYGDMLANLIPGDIYLVTTNSYIRRDGALVMGRGAAKQLAHMYPTLPYELGKRITHLGEYNTGILTDIASGLSLGAFQVKYNFADAADLDLIQRSADELHTRAIKRRDRVFHVNFPGIGNGRLTFNDVLPIVARLPDNVCVWTFK